MNRDLDFQHIKLSDFVWITDKDISYASNDMPKTTKACNECGQLIETHGATRCFPCKRIHHAKYQIARYHRNNPEAKYKNQKPTS